ncbi:MAG: hypothetical protein BRC29_01465 [Nanohaloarchaea archaeon SW_7_43_1]|nr:MAG: hypothetical protein BRC29_01465 [Nanohaloarchaea archaeon SW_7_43_1]
MGIPNTDGIDKEYAESSEIEIDGFRGLETGSYDILDYFEVVEDDSDHENCDILAVLDSWQNLGDGDLSQGLEEGVDVVLDSRDYYDSEVLDMLPNDYDVNEDLESYWGTIDGQGSKYFVISLD